MLFPCYLMEDSNPYFITNFIKYPHDKLYRDLLNSKTEFSLFLKSFLDYDIDYSLPYRLFEYYTEILRSSTDKNTIKQKHVKFPIVCPIVLYVGEENWNLGTNISEKQFDSKYIGKVNIPYHFIDIHTYTKKELLTMNSCIAYAMALYKCQTEEESIDLLLTLSKRHFSTQRKDFLQRILQFFMKNFLDDKTIHILLKKFKEEELDMDPFVERMKKDRLNYGLKMKEEGISEVIKNMLKSGLSFDEIKKYSGCTKKNIEKIKREMEATV